MAGLHHYSFDFASDKATPSGAGRAVVSGHDVQLYESEDFLISTVGDYLADGLHLGQPLVVIATAAHRRGIQDRMRLLGVDPDELVEGRDAVWLDAAMVMDAFMEGGRPSAELFAATVGSVLQRLTANRPYVVVRAFGEMVDLLWRTGKAEHALTLEAMWNDLARVYRFALLCTYARSTLEVDADAELLRKLEEQHARVLPFEARRQAS
jgi:hypothetical protein